MQAPVIFVMDRGFVLVGRPQDYPPEDANAFIVITDCCVIRRWGTTQGLGQLASLGPLPGTNLDPEGCIRINRRYVLREIPCGEKWASWKPEER